MLNRPDPEAGQPIRRGVSISIQPLERRDKLRRSQTVEKPFLKVKLHKREKEKFWSSFFKSLQDSKGRSPWPLPAGSGIYPFAPRARTKRKKRVHRPAADDPALSFCLQNDRLEFSKLLFTAYLRQQTTLLCAICQIIFTSSTG